MPSEKFLFCKISEDIVTKVTQIRRNQISEVCIKNSERTKNDKFHDKGYQEHILFDDEECRT